jgi:hypothetical protein
MRRSHEVLYFSFLESEDAFPVVLRVDDSTTLLPGVVIDLVELRRFDIPVQTRDVRLMGLVQSEALDIRHSILVTR